MAYTPYSQALPDTSRYTLDPVLQERLYQSVRPDPYQTGMLSTVANDYYADPFGYTNKRFGVIDETLATDKPDVGLGGIFTPDVGLGGMFSPYLNNEDISGDSMGLTEGQRAFIDNESEDAKDSRMGKIDSMLSLAAQALVPQLPVISLAQRGPKSYNDMVQGHARNLAGDTSGYRGTDSNMPSRQPGQPAPIVSGNYVDAINQGLTSAQASNVEEGGGGYSGPGGVGGTGVSAGGGRASGGYGVGGW